MAQGDSVFITPVNDSADEEEVATQLERSQGAQRRLIDSAKALLVAGGWAGASVEEIGIGARMSRGAVNFHFGTKSGLLEQVLRDTVAQFAVPAPGASSLGALIDRYWDAITRDPFEAQVAARLWQEANGPSPQLQPAAIEQYHAVVGRLTSDLTQLQREGIVDPDRSAESLVHMLTTALGGLVLAAGRREVSADCSTFAELRTTLVRGMTPTRDHAPSNALARAH